MPQARCVGLRFPVPNIFLKGNILLKESLEGAMKEINITEARPEGCFDYWNEGRGGGGGYVYERALEGF